MNELTVPAGPGVDGAQLARQLAAQVPEHPRPMGGVPPGSDPVPGIRSDLVEFVLSMLEGDAEIREFVQSAFSVYVAELMLRRGLSRDEAIAQASEIVEQTVQEAQRR